MANQQPSGHAENATVFLSFAGVDRHMAERIAQDMRANGIDVRWDEDGTGWGDDRIAKLEETIQRCSGYVILVGEGGIGRWVKAELRVALRQHAERKPPLPVLPLLLPGVTADRMPPSPTRIT